MANKEVGGERSLLILGNGKSRIYQKGFIDTWEHEIWGCNQVYKEYDELPRLDRITGDLHGLPDVFRFKAEKNLDLTVYVKEVYASHYPNEEVKLFTVPLYLQTDSGTTMVAQALHEGYNNIYVAGFDLGGPDLYIADHEQRNKTAWVGRWRALYAEYTLDRVHFVGKNHKSFILSNLPANTYAKAYLKGVNHLKISLPKSKPIKRKDSVLILGNGTSRFLLKKQISNWKGEIWVCNHAYKEAKDLPRVDRVGSVHNEVAQQANIFKKRHLLNYKIYVRSLEKVESIAHKFSSNKGWSTGSLLIVQALFEKYETIVLAGFDFGGPDIYQKTPLYGGNFQRQFDLIKKQYNTKNVFFLTNKGLKPILSQKEIVDVSEELERTVLVESLESAFKMDRPKEYDFLKDCKSLLIIGNGSSVLKKKFGDKIDRDFDVIVRINDYVIKGYESYIGSRTHFWVSGAGNQTRITDRSIQHIQPLIMLPIAIHEQGRDLILERIRKNIGEYILPYASLVSYENILRICELSENYFPTTGLMSVVYFALIKKIPKVSIYGFDFFSPNRHYYDKEGEFRVGALHNIEREKEFIAGLLRNKDIINLGS